MTSPVPASDLDTARDMAQALLPAAAEDDSEHQLLLMRVYIAARRPAPLAALLARWYQQRGQLTLAQSVSLLEALATSGQLEQLQQVRQLSCRPLMTDTAHTICTVVDVSIAGIFN